LRCHFELETESRLNKDDLSTSYSRMERPSFLAGEPANRAGPFLSRTMAEIFRMRNLGLNGFEKSSIKMIGQLQSKFLKF
jgi:hypothetical protein